jgi:hypothetical protein
VTRALAVVALAVAACGAEVVRLGGGSPGDGSAPASQDASSAVVQDAPPGDATPEATGEAQAEASGDGGPGPVAIATGRSSPSWIVVDGTSVYWSEDGAAGTAASPNAVMKAATDGTGLTVLHADTGFPQGVAFDGTYVYFVRSLQPPDSGVSTGVEIDRIAKTGDPTTFAAVYRQSAGILGGLAVDASNAYFAVGSGVLSVPKTATLGTATKVGPNFGTAWEIAVDGTLLYVGDTARSPPVTALDVTNGVIAWSAGTGSGLGVSFDAAYVFWTSGTGVSRASKGGGSATALAACATECDAVVSDDVGVAWATLGDVTESALDGTQARTIASGFAGIHHAAIDPTDVYFTDTIGGGVWRVAR